MIRCVNICVLIIPGRNFNAHTVCRLNDDNNMITYNTGCTEIKRNERSKENVHGDIDNIITNTIRI